MTVTRLGRALRRIDDEPAFAVDRYVQSVACLGEFTL